MADRGAELTRRARPSTAAPGSPSPGQEPAPQPTRHPATRTGGDLAPGVRVGDPRATAAPTAARRPPTAARAETARPREAPARVSDAPTSAAARFGGGRPVGAASTPGAVPAPTPEPVPPVTTPEPVTATPFPTSDQPSPTPLTRTSPASPGEQPAAPSSTPSSTPASTPTGPVADTGPVTGHPLPDSLRSRMETAFGADFSAVRVHDDAASRARAATLGTDAFTAGADIHLGTDLAAAGTGTLAHELAHVRQAQLAADAAITPTTEIGAPDGPEEHEASAAAADALAGQPVGPLHPARAAVMRDDPAPRSLVAIGRLVQVPGKPGYYPVYPGAPFEADALLTLLRLAVSSRRSRREAMAINPAYGLVVHLTTEAPPLDIPEILRLADRATWIRVRALFEAETGRTLLGDLQATLSERELGAALPYLRGVVPSIDLIRVWSGTFSSDVPGVVRALERIPDAEALALAVEYRNLSGITGTTARTLANGVESVLEGEEGGAYRALRALSVRMERLAAVTAAEVTEDDRQSARDLAAEIRILAAFARIKEADRRYRADWAYLAVVDLGRREKDGLDLAYLASWHGRYIAGARRRTLDTIVRSTLDDADLVLATLERASAEARETHRDESQLGLEVATTALGTALSRLAARAADPTLSDAERQTARERLAALGEDTDVIERVLALPGGERVARQGLGVSASEVARRRVLRASTVSEVVDALRGLHSLDVSRILSRPDVEAHLAAKEIVVNPRVQRVLTAYGDLAGTQAEMPFVLPIGTTFAPLTLPDVGGLGEDEELAPVVPALGPLVVVRDTEEDPLVTVAAYEAYRAAKNKDVAGVMAAVRNLRPGQRAAIQDDEFFRAALTTLREMRSDAAKTVAAVLADPHRPLAEASTALVAGGLMGEPGNAFDVQDERMLTEGLAVDPADRRLLRYRYVLDELTEEDRLAGVTDYYGRRTALGSRGVPVDFALPERLESAYTDRTYAIGRLDPTPRLRMEEVFLGEPEVMRADITPEEAALEAQFMRIRLDRHLAALARGIDASGVFGWSPETLAELTEEFRRTFATLGGDGRWTREDLVTLAAAYYDALDAVARNRSERDAVADFVGTLAATVAAVVVIVATGGTATPFVVTLLAGAAVGAAASATVANAFRDYTDPDQALVDIGRGAVTGALTVAGDVLAKPVAAIVSRQMAGFAARSAVNRAVAGGARLAVEGAIDGAIGGAGDAVFTTAIDRRTWERGVVAAFTKFLSAAIEGAFWGGVLGGVASPVLGGAVAGAGLLAGSARRLLTRAGVALGDVPATAAAKLERIGALADSGRYDVALRRLDEVTHLTGADRDRITQELYRRALASTEEGAAVSPDMISRLDEARRVTRRLEYERAPARPGEPRPRLDVAPVEDLLRRLERDLGAAEVARVRKIVYGEIRLAPEELLVKQVEFEKALDGALDTLLSPAERAALPPVEVRVLPPEAFEGMFRSSRGRALTIVEGDSAVVYVRSDAPVRAHMLQEAGHLRQLTDPEMAADVRFLAERNVLDWADKAAEDRLHLLDVQRRLEIDAQQRIIAALEKDAPYAADALAANAELDLARARLTELRTHEAQARAISATELAEMNAGIRRQPDWMTEEARLFGTEVVEVRPSATLDELRRTATPVGNARGLKSGERAFQLGEEWTKRTYTTSGVDGTVESVTDLGGGKVVTVTPTGGGESRAYIINSTAVDVAESAPVTRGQRLGSESQQYRLVEIRKPGSPARLREEVLDVRGRWVERGSSRTTRGEVLEEAAELQVTAQLTTAVERRAAAARPGRTSLRRWFRVEFPPQRRGFDRVFVEFRGDGADTVAVIRVLEVKDYPNSYVPLGEFTAITDNFQTNWLQLKGILDREVGRLAAAGDAEAARALRSAVASQDLTVEIWLGPTTKMGAETSAGSVLAALRARMPTHGSNVRLAEGAPKAVSKASQRRAVAARTAARGTGGPAPPPATTP